MSKMTLSEELQWRGFVNQTTLTDSKLLDTQKFKLYFGVDPSADSMTVGNLAAAMMVKTFLKHGHEVTLLVGGATGMIGDPGGKDEERNLLTLEQVETNKKAVAHQYKQIFEGDHFRLVDNYEWFKDINYLDFLRDVGKHFSMTPLLQRDFISSRIGPDGAGISYAEFSYTLIQGYDYYYLNQKYDIDLQVCGADQWGNSISGVELIRRKTGKEVHIYSAPLIINRATGKKFGKSEDGAVWLDSGKTSVYKFYQFWLNMDDESVVEYLKIFTELSPEKIEDILANFNQDQASRLAQKTLAYEVTKLVHGEKAAESVKRITEVLFSGRPLPDITSEDVDQMKNELPVARMKDGDEVSAALSASGLAASLGEARRLILQGGVYLNNERVAPDKIFSQADRIVAGSALLKKGKNSFALIDIATS